MRYKRVSGKLDTLFFFPSGSSMDKPQKKSVEYYEWIDIAAYIERKYGKELRCWGEMPADWPPGRPYHDFWHWVCDYYEVHKGKLFQFGPGNHLYDAEVAKKNGPADVEDVYISEMYPDWVLEVLRAFQAEFGDEFWVRTWW